MGARGRRVDGIFLSDFEQEAGPISARLPDRPYHAGRSPHWIKKREPKASRDVAGHAFR